MEPSLNEFEVVHGPLDSQLPTVTIAPSTPTQVPVGGILSLTIIATDTFGISSVQIQFDANGDGAISPASEQRLATLSTPNTFTATFLSISGAVGSRTLSVSAADDSGFVSTTSSTIRVETSGNRPPVLSAIGNKSVNELSTLNFVAIGNDPDVPANALTFSLIGAPSGATINPATGSFAWTPTEAQGPGSFTFTVRVTDNGSTALSDEETITVTVNEVNQAPVLSAIGNKTVVSTTPLTFTAAAADADLPANALTFSLLTAPSGATINSTTGAFSWTPSAAQGTGSFTFTVRVTDNGTPALFDEEQITVTVQTAQANNAPTGANDSAFTLLDQSTTISVLSNDTDSDGNLVLASVTIMAAPQHGTATPQSDGRIIYQPTTGYTGPDTFTYTVQDNLGATSNAATVSITVSANNPRQVIATGSGDGQVSITVDGFGAFGSVVFTSNADAIYNPVGSIGAGGTTFESGVALRVGDTGARQFLTSGVIGSSGGLVNPAITQNGSSYVSSFVIGGIAIDLTQSVIALKDALGNPTGSELRQVYTLRNDGTTATQFELIRYIDGDLQFDSSIQDGGGRLVSSNGTEFLFETDAGGSGSTDTTFFGITAEGGAIPSNGRFEVDSYQGLRNRIIAGDPLDGIIIGDANGDGFVETGSEYDITLALRNFFDLAVGATGTYTTRTIFGSGAPATVVEQPQGIIAGTKFNDLNGNAVRDKGLVSGTDPDVVFVIDVSGSTADFFGGTTVGDLNNDGDSNRILDAEIAGFIALNRDLVNKGLGQIADVSIVAFSSSASGVDLDPTTAGIQTTTKAGADKNGNSVLDVEEALRGLGYGGGTDFEAALRQSITILQGLGTSPENGNVVFLSDGVPNSAGAHADEVAQLKTIANNVRAFGVGTGASLGQLQIIDTRAVRFTTTDELLSAFQGVGPGSGSTEVFTEPGLAGVTIYIDLNNNGQLDAGEPNTLTRQDDSATTTVNELGTYQFTQLVAGTYTVREVVPSGFQQTLPGGASRAYTITLAANAASTANDFGNIVSRATNSISGYVYADVDNNGNRFVTIGGRQVPQTGLPNAKVELINTATGAILETLTKADGFYEFTTIADGTYRLRETQPIIFVDGKDTAGTPALATLGGVIINDAFENLQLVGGVAASEYNFGERGLKAAYVTKSLLLSSTPGNATLAAQYDPNARFKITASSAGVLTFAGIPQGATAQLFTLSNQPLAMSVVGETARYSIAEGEGVYLVIENVAGTTTPSLLSVSVKPKESHQSFYTGVNTNAFLAADVNGDGVVTPIDALLIINRLNSQGIGLLESVATHFIDVNRDSYVSPIDALLVINHLNSKSQMLDEGEVKNQSQFDRKLVIDTALAELSFDDILKRKRKSN